MSLISHGRLGGRRFHQVMDPDTGGPALWICLECRGELQADAASFERHDCWNYQKMPRPRVKRRGTKPHPRPGPPASAEDLRRTYVRDLEERLALVSEPALLQEAMNLDRRPTAAPLYRTRLEQIAPESNNQSEEET